MSASKVQALLRFLSQDAKLPLARAMGTVKRLQDADLDEPEKLAKVQAKDIISIFSDEKVAKQIVAAAKRVSKKRVAGEEPNLSAKKARKQNFSDGSHATSTDLESDLALPAGSVGEDELADTVIFTNRAPLVLAFIVTLLKYTMPEQPLSSRLSLAQGYVSTTSRARAVSLGIQEISRAEETAEKQLGEGQPFVTIMGKELRVLRRWGYEWQRQDPGATYTASSQSGLKGDVQDESGETNTGSGECSNGAEWNSPDSPVWALDLEALRKSNRADTVVANAQAGNHSNLPIYTPQSARAYLLRSFDCVSPAGGNTTKKTSAAKAAEKECNLGKLLQVLDLLYESWAPIIGPVELEKRTWNWYVQVRPEVQHGAAGWGGKNEVKLADILALRRAP